VLLLSLIATSRLGSELRGLRAGYCQVGLDPFRTLSELSVADLLDSVVALGQA